MSEQRPFQKIVVLWLVLLMSAAFIVPGLDRRFGWSNVPPWFSIAGDLLILVSMWMSLRVFKENSFGSATVEVAKDQKVISTGPYALVRHPMYSSAAVYFIGLPLALGSYWGLIPALLAILCLVLRLFDEERFPGRESGRLHGLLRQSPLAPDAGDFLTGSHAQQSRNSVVCRAMTPGGEFARDPNYLTMEIRVRGRVQGVGFRPTVWRMARELDLAGEVLNDAEGVLMRVGGDGCGGQRLPRPDRARAAAAGAHRRGSRRQPIAADCRPQFRIAESASGRRAYPGRARRRDLRGVRGRDRRSVRAPLPLSVRQLHALRAAAEHRHRASPTTAPRRRWRLSPCAAPARRISTIRPIAASMPRRSPAMSAAPGRSADPLRRPRREFRPAARCSTTSTRRAPCCRKGKSSRSRVSAAITSPATRPTPTRSRGCAS